MGFTCERCGHTSSTKGNLMQHLQKKTECPAIVSHAKREELVRQLVRVSMKPKIHACTYCQTKFSTPQGKSQHKKVCPNNPDKEMQNRIQSLAEDIKKLQMKIHDLPNKTDETLQVQKLQDENNKLREQIYMLQAKKNEDFYQYILEQHFNATHKKLKIGITDITTDDTHIEIKRWSCWREAYAQLLLYNSHDPKEKLHACFFGDFAQCAKDLAIESLRQQNIVCFELHQTQDLVYMLNIDDNTKEIVWCFDKSSD